MIVHLGYLLKFDSLQVEHFLNFFIQIILNSISDAKLFFLKKSQVSIKLIVIHNQKQSSFRFLNKII